MDLTWTEQLMETSLSMNVPTAALHAFTQLHPHNLDYQG